MVHLANMLWRIGDVLDIDGQLAWTRAAGFEGVGLHASAGVPGQWRGIAPATCDAAERGRLRGLIEGLAFAEIHAPFAIELRTETLRLVLGDLEPVLAFARDLGVGTVTVHAYPPEAPTGDERAQWRATLAKIEGLAARAGTRVALEIVQGFDGIKSLNLEHVGINLDVGHMYLPSAVHRLEELGGIGALIRRLGGSLVHLHLHDVVGPTDHIEIGTGVIDYDEIAGALRDIGYAHNATLELNPDRVSPDGIVRSKAYVEAHLRQATL